MEKKGTVFYFVSLLAVLAASAYPLYMGVKILVGYFTDGAVQAADYPKYVIPYAPVCFGILLVTLLFPLLYKLLKRHSLWAGSLLGIGVFAAGELWLEQIKVVAGTYDMVNHYSVSAWQYSMCAATPEVLQSIGKPVYAANNPAFKVHFYLIAIVIIITVTGLVYGFTHMFREGGPAKKKPLITQTVCTAVFIGLCILACFTAFYRNGTLQISPLSSLLTGGFFVVFGVTFGVYFGCVFYGKRKAFSIMLPSVAALLTTAAMYAGELVLMGGKLFSFGNGWFFEPLGTLPFAPCDFLVLLLAAALTYLVLVLIGPKPGKGEI